MNKITIDFTDIEMAALNETADLSNDGVCSWARLTLLNATLTNDEKRLAIRREFLKPPPPLVDNNASGSFGLNADGSSAYDA